jgi:hypothetical protein
MVLGLRALVAAGAESVMTLHASRYCEFRPKFGPDQILENKQELEQYLEVVRDEGESFSPSLKLNSPNPDQMCCMRLATAS